MSEDAREDPSAFTLDATKASRPLGLDDASLAPLVAEPELVKEIDALRARECR